MYFKKPLLPLKLQMFAETDTPAEDEANEDENQQPEEAKFTQEDLDKAIAERLKRENRKTSKTMKELQDELDRLKNANKPEEERQSEELQTLQTTATTLQEENTGLKLQLEALKAGVPADKLEKFAKLAHLSEADEVEDRVRETLADFPEFAAVKEPEEKKPSFARPGNPTGAVTTMSKAEIMKIKDPIERQSKIQENIHLFQH